MQFFLYYYYYFATALPIRFLGFRLLEPIKLLIVTYWRSICGWSIGSRKNYTLPAPNNSEYYVLPDPCAMAVTWYTVHMTTLNTSGIHCYINGGWIGNTHCTISAIRIRAQHYNKLSWKFLMILRKKSNEECFVEVSRLPPKLPSNLRQVL